MVHLVFMSTLVLKFYDLLNTLGIYRENKLFYMLIEKNIYFLFLLETANNFIGGANIAKDEPQYLHKGALIM